MRDTKNRFSVKSFIAYVVWILTASVLIFWAVEDINDINYDIDMLINSPVIEPHNEIIDEVSAEAGPVSEDTEVSADRKSIEEQQEKYLQELTAQKKIAIVWSAAFCIYALAGLVMYFVLREKGNTKMLLYILLIVIDLVVFNHFPF